LKLKFAGMFENLIQFKNQTNVHFKSRRAQRTHASYTVLEYFANWCIMQFCLIFVHHTVYTHVQYTVYSTIYTMLTQPW